MDVRRTRIAMRVTRTTMGKQHLGMGIMMRYRLLQLGTMRTSLTRKEFFPSRKS
jgi:hypothetical protein